MPVFALTALFYQIAQSVDILAGHEQIHGRLQSCQLCCALFILGKNPGSRNTLLQITDIDINPVFPYRRCW